MCRLCGAERAANWFAVARGNLSGRHSYCRLGRDADTGLCWHLSASPWISALLSMVPPHMQHATLPPMQTARVHPAPAGFDISSTADDLPAGHVRLIGMRIMQQPCVTGHQTCQMRRSAGGVTRYAQCQAFARLFLHMSALPLDETQTR